MKSAIVRDVMLDFVGYIVGLFGFSCIARTQCGNSYKLKL